MSHRRARKGEGQRGDGVALRLIAPFDWLRVRDRIRDRWRDRGMVAALKAGLTTLFDTAQNLRKARRARRAGRELPLQQHSHALFDRLRTFERRPGAKNCGVVKIHRPHETPRLKLRRMLIFRHHNRPGKIYYFLANKTNHLPTAPQSKAARSARDLRLICPTSFQFAPPGETTKNAHIQENYLIFQCVTQNYMTRKRARKIRYEYCINPPELCPMGSFKGETCLPVTIREGGIWS